MPLSAQVKSHAALVTLGRDILNLDPGFYILENAAFRRDKYVGHGGPCSASYHRRGSWHVYPRASAGSALDVNWQDPQTGSRAREHEMLQRAAWLALSRGFSITFPLGPGDYVAGHTGAALHCHVDPGSYSNIGHGSVRTSAVRAAALAFLAAKVGHVAASDVLRRGSRGKDVREVQSYLGVKADGVYGAKTEAAVRKWQKRYRLDVDGQWGPACRECREVLRVQRIVGAKADGVNGSATKAAVKRSQRIVGVKADGKWGPKSDAAYRAFCDGVLGKGTITAWQHNAGTPEDGRISHPSTLIRKVQRDGSKSKSVRKRYKLTGREVDGVLGPNTWAMLCDLMGIKITRKGTKYVVACLQRRIVRGRY